MLFLAITAASGSLAAEEYDENQQGFLFRLPTGGRIKGRPAADLRGNILFASEDRYIYRVSREGKILRRDDLPGIPGDFLSVGVDGTTYMGLRRPRLTALNNAGRVIWNLGLDEPLTADPVSGSDGQIYAVAGKTMLTLDHRGTLLWKENLETSVYGQPLIDSRGRLILPESSGFLQAWYPWGEPSWRFRLAGPAVALAAGDEYLYAASNEGTLAAVTSDGHLSWSRQLSGPGYFLSEVPGGIAVLEKSGTVTAFNSAGDELFRIKTPLTRPAALFTNTGGGLTACGEDGTLSTISPRGEIIQTLKLPGVTDRPGMAGKDLLAGGGADWNLYVYRASPDFAGDLWNGPGAASGSRWNRRLIGGLPRPAPWQTDPDYLLIQAFMEQPGRFGREKALALAEEKLGEGEPGNYRYPPFYADTVRRIAAEAFEAPLYSGSRVSNDYPDLRLRSVKLLAAEGAFSSRKTLQRITREGWQDEVIAAAMEGLGNIGSDADGSSCRAIASVLEAEGVARGNSLLVRAGIGALGKILDYNGAIPDFSLYRSALAVYRLSPDGENRKYALELIQYRN